MGIFTGLKAEAWLGSARELGFYLSFVELTGFNSDFSSRAAGLTWCGA